MRPKYTYMYIPVALLVKVKDGALQVNCCAYTVLHSVDQLRIFHSSSKLRLEIMVGGANFDLVKVCAPGDSPLCPVDFLT